MFSRLLLIVLSLGFVAADAAKDDAAARDLKALQGEWEVVAIETNGQKGTEETIKSFRRKIDGDKYVITIKKGDDEHKVEGTITLDPSKTPKAFDAKTKDHGGNEIVVHGIYQLEGDTHKVCIAGMGGERPTDFTAAEGSMRNLIVWKRVKS